MAGHLGHSMEKRRFLLSRAGERDMGVNYLQRLQGKGPGRKTGKCKGPGVRISLAHTKAEC